MTGSRADTVDGARDDRGPALAVDPTSKGRARPAPPPLGFMVAAGGATIVVALGAIVLELNPPARIEGLLPELVAGAALCVGLLARRWAPALAWVWRGWRSAAARWNGSIILTKLALLPMRG